jgi:hypothetical protein
MDDLSFLPCPKLILRRLFAFFTPLTFFDPQRFLPFFLLLRTQIRNESSCDCSLLEEIEGAETAEDRAVDAFLTGYLHDYGLPLVCVQLDCCGIGCVLFTS